MRHIPFLIVLAIVSLVMTRGNEQGATRDRPKAGVWTALQPSLSAPTGEMLMADGSRKTLADYKGKVVLLNLWATWCPPCLHELPTLDALDASHAGKGLKVITLSIDELSLEQVEAFLEMKLKLEMKSLALDDTEEVYRYLNARGLPVTYLIDKEGRVTHRFVGATDWTSEEALKPIEAALGR